MTFFAASWAGRFAFLAGLRDFRGKSGVFRQVNLHSPVLARIVRQCQDLSSQDLFQYRDGVTRVGCFSSPVVRGSPRRTRPKNADARTARLSILLPPDAGFFDFLSWSQENRKVLYVRLSSLIWPLRQAGKPDVFRGPASSQSTLQFSCFVVGGLFAAVFVVSFSVPLFGVRVGLSDVCCGSAAGAERPLALVP